ncbi:hypothetical protein V8D89_016338 [Ganoderma adspersum]
MSVVGIFLAAVLVPHVGRATAPQLYSMLSCILSLTTLVLQATYLMVSSVTRREDARPQPVISRSPSAPWRPAVMKMMSREIWELSLAGHREPLNVQQH